MGSELWGARCVLFCLQSNVDGSKGQLLDEGYRGRWSALEKHKILMILKT